MCDYKITHIYINANEIKYISIERNIDHKNINLIDYSVGPVNIYLLLHLNQIILETNAKWEEDLLEILEYAEIAWEIDTKIIIDRNKIIIPLNYNILKNYLTYIIILYDEL